MEGNVVTKNDIFKSIKEEVDLLSLEFGDDLDYVSFPFINAQFLDRLHVLTPTGIDTLSKFREILRSL